MTFRPEFIQGLNILAKAGAEMVRRGYGRPVLVGGAAVEYYTSSHMVSGDYDVVTGAQSILEEILIGLGFERPQGKGQLVRGLYHPHLQMGFEVVSGQLMDGRADAGHVEIVLLDEGEILVTPVEICSNRHLPCFALQTN